MTNQLVKLRLCPLGAKWRNYWRQLCQGLGKGQCSESLLFNLLPPDFIDTRPAPRYMVATGPSPSLLAHCNLDSPPFLGIVPWA